MSNTGIRNIHKIRSQTGYAIEITNQRKKYVAYAKTLEEAIIKKKNLIDQLFEIK